MKGYNRVVIYYFSGTGNAGNVARWVSAATAKNSIECRIVDIAKVDKRSITAPLNDALTVFISPVHGFNYPPVMLNFITSFPKGKGKVLLMNTRAGMMIGKHVTPGLSGIAFYLSAAIFRMKGYSTVGMIPVDMPSNWISFHPTLSDRIIKCLHERNEEIVTRRAENILSGKSDFRALRDIIQDVIVSPVAILYYLCGRFVLAKTFYASSDCDNCGVCVKNCPVKAIKKVDNRPYWTFNCESCMKCMSYCPRRAIQTAHGFIIGVAMFYSGVVSVLFYKFADQLGFSIESGIVRLIVSSLLFLCLLGAFYRLIHYLMRFKFVAKGMAFTSLTSYKFWGKRYRALREKP